MAPHISVTLESFLQEFTRYLYRLIALFVPSSIPDDLQVSKPEPRLGWWVEVFTVEPPCLYYFGDFDTFQEAEDSQHGFVQDLIEEGSKGVKSQLQKCQPKRLTVDFN